MRFFHEQAVGAAAETAAAGLAMRVALVARFIVCVYCQRATAVVTPVCGNGTRRKSARSSGAVAKRSCLCL